MTTPTETIPSIYENLLNGSRDTLGQEWLQTIESAKILVVGAGGIGCELLKNLAYSGFKTLEVVDLDIIELSNLNRQFLFKREHIGKSKSLIARESILKMVPDMRIVSHCANIKDMDLFPLPWWSSFDIILSALDNLEARRWVNRMAVMANVPVVESGTDGYHGQSSVCVPGQTECYDCRPHEPPKTYPVCTIRATPTTMIHCIVWAKEYLFGKLFGEKIVDGEEAMQGVDERIAKQLAEEAAAFRVLEEASEDDLPLLVFQKVFQKDLEDLAKMGELWKERAPPKSLEYESVDFDWTKADSMHDWSPSQWTACFRDSCKALRRRDGTQSFDKDDTEAMALVASAANLRAMAFGISPSVTLFKATEMAGNIIPAIATTNAMAAALVTLQAMNVLKGRMGPCATIYITHGMRNRVLVREALEPPNPLCAVCGTHRALLTIKGEVGERTVRDILDAVPLLSDADPEDIVVMSGSRIIYDIDISESAPLRTLSQLAISNGHSIHIIFGDGLYHQLQLGIISGTEDRVNIIHSPPKPIPVLGKRGRVEQDGDFEEIEQSAKEIRLDEEDLIIL